MPAIAILCARKWERISRKAFVATLMAGLVSPPPPGVDLTAWQTGCLAMFFAGQAAAAGVVMGWLFQRLYRSIDARPGGASASSTSSARTLGDLSLQIKPLTT